MCRILSVVSHFVHCFQSVLGSVSLFERFLFRNWYTDTMNTADGEVPAHKVFTFGEVTFSSNFDNGNLARVEQVPNKSYDFRIWTAPDNMGTEYQSKHCAWYYFMVTGLPQGCVLRIQIVNTSNHSGLYKYDMVRPLSHHQTRKTTYDNL